MPTMLIAFGLLLAVLGLGVIVAGAPDWAYGLALGSAMIQSGAIVFIGGLMVFGIGLLLRELRQLGRRLDAFTPVVSRPEIAAELESEPSIVPPEIPIPLSHPLRSAARSEPAPAEPAAHPSARRVSADEPDLRPRAWPPSTRGASVAEAAPRARAEPVASPTIEAPMPPSAPAPRAREVELESEPSGAVVRSGIIGGMAYSLYADGSIEAELPIGTMRFASLDELREHVAHTGTAADAEFSGPAPKQ